MSITEAARKAAQQEMTTCIRCPKVIPTGSPSIPHMPGWACSQKCSTEADEEELARHAQSQQAVGVLFAQHASQSRQQ